jgi:hypothetical protein
MKLRMCAAVAAAVMIASVAGAADTHDHSKDAGHAGKAVEIGTTETAGMKIKVVQEGEVKAGAALGAEIEITGTKTPPKAVRIWVGTEKAEGSIKAKAAKESDTVFHGHVETPNPLPEGSKLWVEVQADENKKVRLAFDLKR